MHCSLSRELLFINSYNILHYFCYMNSFQKAFFSFLTVSVLFAGCLSVDVFEKNISFKTQEWASANKAVIPFEITDTASLYNVYIVFRHTNAYNYNNLWLKWSVQQPGIAPVTNQFNLPLANNEQGWLGSGMDDIYEHRILVQPRTSFGRTGAYTVTMEQIMRQDPLQHVLNIGLRVEKIK